LGVTFYFLLKKSFPFRIPMKERTGDEDEKKAALMNIILANEPAPFPAKRLRGYRGFVDVPIEVQDLVLGMLAHDPEARVKSIDEVIDRLIKITR
jgi:hypothetical protein